MNHCERLIDLLKYRKDNGRGLNYGKQNRSTSKSTEEL